MPINTPTNENENNEEFKTLPPDLQKNVDDFKKQINEIQSTSKVNLSPQELKKMYDEKKQKSLEYNQYGGDSDSQGLLAMRHG